MENKVRLFGSPLHTMLLTIPLGLFVIAIILDTIFLFTKSPSLPSAAFLNISVGIIGGFLAVIFGFQNWLSLPDNTAVQRTGAMYGVNIVIVILMFVISWWLRSRDLGFVASPLAMAFSYCAITLAILAAWLSESSSRLRMETDEDIDLGFPLSIFDEQDEGSFTETLADARN